MPRKEGEGGEAEENLAQGTTHPRCEKIIRNGDIIVKRGRRGIAGLQGFVLADSNSAAKFKERWPLHDEMIIDAVDQDNKQQTMCLDVDDQHVEQHAAKKGVLRRSKCCTVSTVSRYVESAWTRYEPGNRQRERLARSSPRTHI